VPFIAIWLYEGANWISVACQGYSTAFNVSGWLPLGVGAVSSGGISPLTKVLQVILAVSFLVPFASLFRRTKLLVSRTLVVSMAGVFIASSYWELLSATNTLPMAVHTIIFVASAGATSFLTLWLSDRPRRIHLTMGMPARS
jgi:hypothetical protein